MTKLEVKVNMLALSKGLRAAYWCQEYRAIGNLKRLALKHGLRVSTMFPRLVYNPGMVSEEPLNRAFDFGDRDEVAVGRLLGYPCSAGDTDGQYWVVWQVRDKLDVGLFYRLFTFRMKHPDMHWLVSMKNQWNEALTGHYIDFYVRYREKGNWSDA